MWKLLRQVDEDDGQLWKGREVLRNASLIPSVRTIVDSKLGVDLYRGSALLEHYRAFLLEGIWL
ncbi:hypothetical protein BHE74_00009095 [Ensete ventricosum]|nr:hypothetical protein GW17_00061247 [Ensete ventricosum]RWW82440.1 hypothetical protein BHE74_00009095 [Ensete ventricosum]RZR94586.1 hypothetical protein BHM03_00023313 [Ensete ventricosum]